MTAIGVDIIEIERVESVISQWGGRFLDHIDTGAELEIYQNSFSSLATRFATKEAMIKVLGAGGQGIG